MRIAATYSLGAIGSEENIASLLDIIIAGVPGASLALKSLIYIDQKLYYPRDWPTELIGFSKDKDMDALF